MKLAFDIGGVLGKYPSVFLPMVSALGHGGAEVFVITEIKINAEKHRHEEL